jgi:Xaa-Pro aminopeptidase
MGKAANCPAMADFDRRRQRLRQLLRKKADVHAILVTSFPNVSYLTGFTGDDSYLLLTPNDAMVLSDPRYTTQLQEECDGVELIIRTPGSPILKSVAKTVRSTGIESLAVEGTSMTVSAFQSLREYLPRVEFVTTNGLVEQLREIKDKSEIERIRDAVKVAERAFGVVKASLRGADSEKHTADLLEHQIRLFGGSCCSFPPIVAVGPRAALPHAQPGATTIEESGFVLLDWGATVQSYLSDLTRMVITGKVPSRFERIYDIVLAAQKKAISVIRPGTIMEDVDSAARQVIEEAGFGKRFSHSLGHGIGLQIHEQPRLGVDQKRPLKAGMIVTVEPGIYIPGWGGVRIEDDVLVTARGCEVLSTVGKELADCTIA